MKIASGLITIDVASAQPTGNCPACGEASSRIHSRYVRKLMDLPWHGKQVQVRWRSRRLFCDAAACPRQIFTERLPEVAAPHARTTSRVTQALRAIGITCGGEGGARLGQRLGMLTSPDRVLRIIRRVPLDPVNTPRVLGVDDFAFRRGHRYGTILCDLEQRRAVDLLPERSSESFRDWLRCHPGVEVIGRDRGDYYVKGATEGAPQAIQVADRWHLLTNLREALMRAADRFPQQILSAERAAQDATELASLAPMSPAANPPENTAQLTRAQQMQQPSRARRLKRYEQVLALHRQGMSHREIARQLGIHRGTVRRFLNADAFPDRAARRYRKRTDHVVGYLRTRWDEGCRNAAQLFADLRQQGFDGSYDMVRRRVAAWRKERRATGQHESSRPRVTVQRPSSNRIAWLLFQPPSDPADNDYVLARELCAACPQLAKASELATEFASMLREKKAEVLDDWIVRARAPESVPELRRFAQGLQNDWSAVKAAFSLPWSNGQTEGHVNRLKLIKRQMFGRAKFDLLRLRFLNAG